MTSENPFSMGELGDLMEARLRKDFDYLNEWTYRATEWYEHEKNRLLRLSTDNYEVGGEILND